MKHKSNGFTLVELLVVIAASVLLTALLFPVVGCGSAVGQARMNADLVQTVANGANIYKSAFAGSMDDVVLGGGKESWPQIEQFRTSTEYFIGLVKSGTMNVTYDFFSAPGIPPANSSDANDFTANNNAWRLVLGLDKANEGTPFLFTRNYDPGSIQGGDEPLILNGQPFGNSAMVVVLKGGSAYSLRGNQLKNAYFNPAGEPPPEANIAIVGP